MEKYNVAVDVGGTFTDVFMFDEETGKIAVTKVSSTPDNPARETAAIDCGSKVSGRVVISQIVKHRGMFPVLLLWTL
ncbi:hydantoinase/oxoprolinase N-terminal domain-containing protein [Aneurinibacillus uraniidurans]|uniref:hydantoinase/oxoprolinase N-terminal domain-containing protein n=1 Tax=Aneurinibacillus uraniidurans TaxID=2966586 RepID=UPI00300E4704